MQITSSRRLKYFLHNYLYLKAKSRVKKSDTPSFNLSAGSSVNQNSPFRDSIYYFVVQKFYGFLRSELQEIGKFRGISCFFHAWSETSIPDSFKLIKRNCFCCLETYMFVNTYKLAQMFTRWNSHYFLAKTKNYWHVHFSKY